MESLKGRPKETLNERWKVSKMCLNFDTLDNVAAVAQERGRWRLSPACAIVSGLCDGLRPVRWSPACAMVSGLCDGLRPVRWSPACAMVSGLCDVLGAGG